MSKYNNTFEFSNVSYVVFSIMKASEGGISQKDAIAILKENGIKIRRGAHSPYVGHYGLYVEEEFEDKASDLLFG
jgi:hypothetical protein